MTTSPKLSTLSALVLAALSFTGSKGHGASGPEGSAGSQCEETRAAFDIGSGSTKMRVARVDHCLQKVVQVLASENKAVQYKDDLASSKDRSFSRQVRAEGIKALRSLKKKAASLGATRFTGVATSAFRDSENASQFVKTIEKEVGIPVRIISQREEAILGFFGGSAGVEVPREKVVVWDIGGGSMQLITPAPESREWLIYEGQTGSVPFRNRIISEVQGRAPGKVSSPNPISESESRKAVGLAEAASKEIPKPLREKASRKDVMLVGVGNVHNISVKNQVAGGADVVTREELERTLRGRAGLSDEKIGGKYASTEISNLALVLGFLKGIGAKQLKLVKADLNDGVLVNPEYWNEK